MTSAALASAPFIRLAINSDLSRIIDHFPATRPLVAIGDYWFVTPLVYERIRVQGNQETYLIRFRTRRETVRHLVESGRSFTLVYVVIKADDCKVIMGQWSGADASGQRFTLDFSASLESGGMFSVLSNRRCSPTRLRDALQPQNR